MATYQFGINAATNLITDVTVEFRSETGQLIDTFFRSGFISWSLNNADAIGDGDSENSDELISGDIDDLIFWDVLTIASYTGAAAAARYYLPATDQMTAIDIFTLLDGNDVLNLTHNTIFGGVSYDFDATAYGGDGNDLLMSGGGDDRLFGDQGSDTIYGGAGADLIDVGSTFEEAVSEQAYGGSGNDSILGGDGNDTLFGGSEDDRIDGGLGADEIRGDEGNDTLYGGAGLDALFGGADTDTLYGGQGNDNLQGGTGFLDRMFGGDGDDNIQDFEDGMVLMSGGAGDDVMYSNFVGTWVAPGNLATVYGGGGTDTFSMGSSQQNLNLVIAMDDGSADANDSVLLSNVLNQYATVTATLGGGNDTFRGSLGGNGTHIDRVAGDAGNDTLYGGAGSDTLYGGTGFLDFLIGGALTPLATDAGDLLFDIDGVVYASGGEGNDTLNITFAADWVGAGGNASDLVTLDGNGGADSFVLYSLNAAQRLIINTDDGNAADGNDVVDLSGIASSYDVIVTFMRGGDDHYIGTGPGVGTGNRIDIVYGGLGNDTLSGGIGNDTLFGSDVADAASDTGGDTLFGRGGDDVLYGGAGTDSLFGENGVDTLYGGLGDDTLAGGNGADTLYGGLGIDTLDGGADNDVLYFNADNTVTGDNAAQDYVQGWDGSVHLAQHSYSGRTVNWSFDSFEGGTGIDSLVGTAGDDVLLANTDDLYINGVGQASSPGRMGGIEIVLLGAGTDIFIANDPNGNTASGVAFTTSLTVYGGNGADVVYTGNGDDLIVGDETVGGIDILAGGVGNDTIWGDLQGLPDSTIGARDTIYGGGGNDTLYGGAGNDTLFGGNGTDTFFGGVGDDLVIDVNNTGLLFGGDGSDTFLLGYTNADQVLAPSRTGNDDVGDGDDRVYIWVDGGGLQYGSISLAMGAGNDIFITGDVVGGNGIDRISGESGNDVISTWNGNDTIDGGAGDDALWGGAGVDTIFGGPGSDILYGGAGDGDVLVGGDGSDYYYWGRTDGIDRIDDQDTVAGGEADNYILVMPAFNPVTDEMIAGTGVFEADQDLYDNAGGDDMVQLVDLDGAGPGTMYRLTILQGAGAGSSIEFDQTEISVIGLWNNDATAGTPVITAYVWDPIDGRYEYQA